MKLASIGSFQIPQLWEKMLPFIEKSLSFPGAEYKAEDIKTLLLLGHMQAWHVNWKVVIITHVATFGGTEQEPTTRECIISLLAGDGMDDWISELPELEAWAATLKCDSMRIIGRKGWAKVLPDYEPISINLRKKLR